MAGVSGNRRTLYTKKVIKESLIELLKTREIHQVTVTDICKKADINRGTFYTHYKDAFDLFQSMEDELFHQILKYIKEDAYVITLEIGGKQLASEELADKIEQLGIQGKSQIVFIIGGSIGLGKEVLKKSNYALSFSKMTFPHQLMRVILLEQIYRSYRIINREPYHK